MGATRKAGEREKGVVDMCGHSQGVVDRVGIRRVWLAGWAFAECG